MLIFIFHHQETPVGQLLDGRWQMARKDLSVPTAVRVRVRVRVGLAGHGRGPQKMGPSLYTRTFAALRVN